MAEQELPERQNSHERAQEKNGWQQQPVNDFPGHYDSPRPCFELPSLHRCMTVKLKRRR
jgi:hypothetical protein